MSLKKESKNQMKFDFHWSSKGRPIFRICAILLSLVFISMGALAIIEKIGDNPVDFDSKFKFGIAALGWGVIFLIIGIRGRIFKKDF